MKIREKTEGSAEENLSFSLSLQFATTNLLLVIGSLDCPRVAATFRPDVLYRRDFYLRTGSTDYYVQTVEEGRGKG